MAEQASSYTNVIQSTQKAQYLKRQKDSFLAVGGGPDGWKECDLSGIGSSTTIINGVPETRRVLTFEVPAGFATVEPWSDRTPEARPSSDFCQLCGWSPLVNHWPIQNTERRLVMCVGSECVENFMGAGYLTKRIQVFKQTKLRKAFDSWVESAMADCNSRGTKKPWSTEPWLPRPIWEFKRKLEKTTSTLMTSRKIVNIFKKARELGLAIPDSVTGFLGEEEKEEEKKEEMPVAAPAPPRLKMKWEAGVMSVEVDGAWHKAHKENDTWVPDPEPIQQPQAYSTQTPSQVSSGTSFKVIVGVGVYEMPNGDIYVVKPNREGTRVYAKKLVKAPSGRLNEQGEEVGFDFVYEQGAIYSLRPEYKMSAEKAKALSIQYGHCIVCGRHLKVAESVERGIGPVCIKIIGGVTA